MPSGQTLNIDVVHRGLMHRAADLLSIPISDEAQLRRARALQLVCLLGVAYFLIAQGAAWASVGPTRAVGAYLPGPLRMSLLATLLVSLYALRRGRFELAVHVLVWLATGVLAVTIAWTGLRYGSTSLIGIPILLVLPGMLLPRRYLWMAFGLIMVGLSIGHFRDLGLLGGAGPTAPLPLALGPMLQPILVFLLLASVLDRFGASMRSALSDSRARQAELEVLTAQIRDEADRRNRAETALAKTRTLEHLGSLAGGVAHDLNNVLTVILGHADLARSTVSPDQPAGGDLDEVIATAHHAGDLTRQLLTFARRRPVAPQVVGLEDEVAGMERVFRRLVPEDVRIETRWGAPDCAVTIDPVQLQQVVIELVLRARDAMSDGGTLRIATSLTSLDDEAAELLPGLESGDFCVLSMRDTGPRLSESAIRNMFEPFSAFDSHSGRVTSRLGLAACYGIVRQAGGDIEVESTQDAGTEIRVFLRLAPAAAGAIP